MILYPNSAPTFPLTPACTLILSNEFLIARFLFKNGFSRARSLNEVFNTSPLSPANTIAYSGIKGISADTDGKIFKRLFAPNSCTIFAPSIKS